MSELGDSIEGEEIWLWGWDEFEEGGGSERDSMTGKVVEKDAVGTELEEEVENSFVLGNWCSLKMTSFEIKVLPEEDMHL